MRLVLNENQINEIKEFLSSLPKLNENEGFYFLLYLRKKWVKLYYPKDEQKFTNSGEIVLTRFVLDYSDFKKDESLEYVVRKFINNLSVIDDNFGRVKIMKGKKYYTNELFDKYNKSVSLTFVYEPRDILKATMRIVSDYVKKFMYQNYELKDILKFKHQWNSYIHSSNRKNDKKYVMVDVDIEYKNREEFDQMNFNKLNEIYKEIEEELINNQLNLKEKLKYSVTTPSKGIHLIFEIDDDVRIKLFKVKKKFQEMISSLLRNKFNLTVKEVDLKTNPVQTHSPFSFINPTVKRLK